MGIKNVNYTIRDLVEAAQKVIGGCSLVFKGEHGSYSRTNKASFKKILSILKNCYKPEWDSISGGKDLVEFFKKISFTEEIFRGRYCNRLPQLIYLVRNNRINNNLFWTNNNS